MGIGGNPFLEFLVGILVFGIGSGSFPGRHSGRTCGQESQSMESVGWNESCMRRMRGAKTSCKANESGHRPPFQRKRGGRDPLSPNSCGGQSQVAFLRMRDRSCKPSCPLRSDRRQTLCATCTTPFSGSLDFLLSWRLDLPARSLKTGDLRFPSLFICHEYPSHPCPLLYAGAT